uniref:Lipocalin n=1 Tax=Rhipicephalus appendiculatus TaxID=34631 RepID=A0A131YHX5_RHIAP
MKSNMMKISKKPIPSFMLPALIILLNSEHFCSLASWNVPDITKFYAVNEKIWTINSTMFWPKYCQVDVVYAASPKYAFFNRSHVQNHTKYMEYLLGQFTNIDFYGIKTTTRNAMKVAPRNGTSFQSIEQLLYEYDNYKCGVFNVSLLQQLNDHYYDLRVKDSAVKHPNPSCVEMFLELSRFEKVTTLYTNSCLHSG